MESKKILSSGRSGRCEYRTGNNESGSEIFCCIFRLEIIIHHALAECGFSG
jgi:hypothetical protein